MLINSWKAYLEDIAGILFRKNFPLIEYLSLPSDKLKWEAHDLPADNLCIENAILL